MNSETPLLYVHFPLVATTHPVEVMGGTFRRVEFDEFTHFEDDWAVRRIYDRASRTFWVAQIVDNKRSEDLSPLSPNPTEHDRTIWNDIRGMQETALMWHYALICAKVGFLPSPARSIQYIVSPRQIQALERGQGRIWLERSLEIEVTSPELDHALEIMAYWKASKLESGNLLLGPIRTISEISSAHISARASLALLVTSLEGILDTKARQKQLFETILHEITTTLPEENPEQVRDKLKPIYAMRSNFLHGRDAPIDDPADMGWLIQVMIAIVRAKLQIPILTAYGEANDNE